MGSVRFRRKLAGVAAAGVVTLVAACSEGADTTEGTQQLTIGLIAPTSGPYKSIGDDMLAGFNLYLQQHSNQLGGHPVRVVTADEGDGGSGTRAAADKLVKSDAAVALIGTAAAPAAATVATVATSDQVPFIGVGGRPSTIDDVNNVWHTSFQSTDFGKAIGAYLAQNVNGPIYVIGPDYQGGKDQITGFVDAYTSAGGKLANPGGQPVYTPWPATDNFAPWLQQARDAQPAAVYAFYAGAPAINFVNQYQQFGLNGVPLYGPGFLTEGPALTPQAAALKVRTAMPYSPVLDNPTNKTFTTGLEQAGAVPNLYHLTSYDAAAVLDNAIAAAGADPTGENINKAIAGLGPIDSPRGQFTFDPATHTPVQKWYLREAQEVNGRPTNVVIADLPTPGR